MRCHYHCVLTVCSVTSVTVIVTFSEHRSRLSQCHRSALAQPAIIAECASHHRIKTTSHCRAKESSEWNYTNDGRWFWTDCQFVEVSFFFSAGFVSYFKYQRKLPFLAYSLSGHVQKLSPLICLPNFEVTNLSSCLTRKLFGKFVNLWFKVNTQTSLLCIIGRLLK